ncbi:MAG TPA: C4-type zinc ribbon domain-containing protein [Methylomirabilota bacterium]|nr:C4-type zinc ribbon domain-containing protein [Methylomirabilota bacterium]
MQQVIEKLLILQDRDRRIAKVDAELSSMGPQRAALQSRMADATAGLEVAKTKVKQLESERKRLELEAEAAKQRIDKYSTQQLQTKKNDEYRALTNEIDNCRKQIAGLEDQQIEFMEKIEAAQKEVAVAAQAAKEAQEVVQKQITALEEREKSLKALQAELKADYSSLTNAVDENARGRYERLRKTKGGVCIVGVAHSVCGGCHMRLPQQIILSTQAAQELVSCPNCARILYYSRDMDLVAAD